MAEEFQLSGEPPVNPGVSSAFQIQKEGIIEPVKSKFGPNTKLADIQEDYAFFHPGLLYTEVPLERGHDPFADFCAHKNDSKLRPSIFAVGEQFIQGWSRETDSWSRIVFVLNKQVHQEYMTFIASAAFVDRKQNEVWFVSPQAFEINDPSAPLSTPNPKKITITFLGLETNKRTWYFEPLSLAGKVRLIHTMRPEKITDEVRNASRAILGNDIRV